MSDPRVRLTCKHSLGKSLGATIAPSDILGPLINDKGVIFPYTPMINASYVSNYGSHAPTHSNFVYRFFQNYAMQEITCSAEFTSATTAEAKYSVAALHFFKAAMKMGFGENDKNRGVPPPVLNFTGYGPGFFKNIPVVISNLNYALDTSTDYVFARIENEQGTGRAHDPEGPSTSIIEETFIPIKITFILTLSPAYNTYETRKVFTMKDFVSGKLLKKGFS